MGGSRHRGGIVSNLTKAVEQQNAPKAPSLASVAIDRIEKSAPRFSAVLPKGWDMDRYKENFDLISPKAEVDLVRRTIKITF